MRRIPLLLVPALLLIGACTDGVFDSQPLDRVSESAVWTQESTMRAVLTDLYADFPFFEWEEDFIELTEESQTDGQSIPTHTNDTDPYWDYEYIREVNDFIERAAEAEVDRAAKEQMLGEARTIRAVVYFEMQKRYGGVPLVDVTLDPFNPDGVDEQYLRRSTEEALADFIDSELSAAAELLGEDHTATGQINKWVAYAYKARANLWAASIAKYGQVQLDGVVGIPASRADEFYAKAAEAADAVIESGRYTLHNALPDKAENYRTIFITDGNSELIFERIYDGPNVGGSFSMNNVPPRFSLGQGADLDPTLEFLLAFENIDGSDDQPTFGPDNLHADGSGPWADKDPRLHATVFLQGDNYHGNMIQTYDGLDPSPQPDPSAIMDNRQETHQDMEVVGPDSRFSDNHFNTDTGFLLEKWTLEPFTARGNEDNNWKAIRLAEIYLIKAEAEFELGNLDAAAAALNMTRERAGISLVTPASITLDHVRNERRSELAYEGHRYWDLRRWRTAQEVLNRTEPFQGLRIIYHYDSGQYYFLPYEAETFTRVFRAEHYYNPITQNRINTNPLLVENPGY